jgi:hypothetical protein
MMLILIIAVNIVSIYRYLNTFLHSSLVICEQPEPVIRKEQKISVSVRLLIGDKLAIRQQLETSKITVRLCSEDQARQLQAGQIRESEM